MVWSIGAWMAVATGLAQVAPLGASLVRDRVSGPVLSTQMERVRGSVPGWTARATDQGALSGDKVLYGLQLVFARSVEQQADLEDLIELQHTPGSAIYHHWLRPAEFAARYGASAHDLQAAVAWLRSQGLTVDAVPASNDRVLFHGTVSQVDAAFQTEVHQYSFRGTPEFANDRAISLPHALAGVFFVTGVRSVPLYAQVVLPHAPTKAGAAWAQYSPANQPGAPFRYLAPADVQTIYDIRPLYNSGNTGSGLVIGVLGQSNILPYMTDIQDFFALTGRAGAALPQQVVVPGTGGALAAAQITGMDLVESDLDVEWAASIAPGATIDYITSGPRGNVLTALRYAIQTPLINNGQDVIPVLSMSYSEGCEPFNAPDDFVGDIQLQQQANAQGQTLVFASGDNGASACGVDNVAGQSNPNGYDNTGVAVDYPASSPYVTAAGGTSFTGDRAATAPYTAQPALIGQYWGAANDASLGSALSYIPEGAWNDALPHVVAGDTYVVESGGGGGPSGLFTSNPDPGAYTLYGYSGGTLQLPVSLNYLAAKPAWQSGPGVLQDGARDLPDVSLAADPDWDAYAVCYEEFNNASGALMGVPSCASPGQIAASNGRIAPFQDPSGTNAAYSVVGGTSAVAPQLAALIALWDQESGQTNGVGNANRLFYQLAQTNPAAFHDVVPNSSFSGANSNAMVCLAGTPSCALYAGSATWSATTGFDVTNGYDMATGLGSVDAAALGRVWGSGATSSAPPDFQLASSVSPVPVSLTALTANVTLMVSPLDGFTGAVTLSCQAPAGSGIACNFAGQPEATVTVGASGGSVLLTVQLASATVTLPNSVLITGTGASQGATLSHQLALPIEAAAQSTTAMIAASVTSASYGTPVTLTYSAYANGAPVTGGGFQLSVNGVAASGWSCTADSSGSCAVTGNDLPVGADSLTVAYLPDAQYTASTSAPVAVTIVAAPAPTVVPATPTLTVTQGGSASSQLTITPGKGFTGTMQLSCSGLPTGATCSFSPATPAFVNGASTTSTMTIQTTGAATSASLRPVRPAFPTQDVPVPAMVFWPSALLLAGALGGAWKRGLRKFLPVVLLALCVGAMTACGGGGTVTPSLAAPSSPAVAATPVGNYTIQIIVSGTGVQPQTINMNLAVQ